MHHQGYCQRGCQTFDGSLVTCDLFVQSHNYILLKAHKVVITQCPGRLLFS